MSNEVKNLIMKIVSKYPYLSIVLFGSRARNQEQDSSDYDLLIIMKEELEIADLRKIGQEIRKELALNYIDADVLVRNQSTVEEYKDKKGTVIYEAMKEGVLL